jgi:NAD(P)-dependent dehydrogenase (short-subunit alcohol dehydrogenase family)
VQQDQSRQEVDKRSKSRARSAQLNASYSKEITTMPDGRGVTGKVAVVTGASRGIGKQTCLELARIGTSIVAVARTVEPRARTPGTLDDTVSAIRAIGGEAIVVQADLAAPPDIERVVATALDHYGHVDVLVNNAAYVGRALFAEVPEITREQWEKGFAVNVTAPLMLIEGFWASMKQRGGGVVVNVTSDGAQLQPLEVGDSDRTALGGGTNYGSTKAALNRMTNAIARQGREYNIAVIALHPGTVLTEMMELALAQRNDEGAGNAMLPTSVPAKAIAYLCSCVDPMIYSGQIVNGPRLHNELGL